MKKSLIILLSILLAPLAALASAVLIAFILASFALVFPIAALGGALKVAVPLAAKIIDLIFGEVDCNFNRVQRPFYQIAVTSLLLQFSLTVIFYIPAAVVIAAVTAFVAPLFFLSLTGIISYYSSKFMVNKVASLLEDEYLTKDETDVLVVVEGGQDMDNRPAPSNSSLNSNFSTTGRFFYYQSDSDSASIDENDGASKPAFFFGRRFGTPIKPVEAPDFSASSDSCCCGFSSDS